MVPLPSDKVPRVSSYSGYRLLLSPFAYGAFTLYGRLSQNRSARISSNSAVHTPVCTHTGLGSSHFARRYFGNRCFLLFLSLLRCFSSGGSPPYVMYWRMDTTKWWVSPFRDLRINGYLLLPEAFRSLSRLSSALSAKASTLRSSSFDLFIRMRLRMGLKMISHLAVQCVYIAFDSLPKKITPRMSHFSYLTFNVIYWIIVYAVFKVHSW